MIFFIAIVVEFNKKFPFRVEWDLRSTTGEIEGEAVATTWAGADQNF
jgi:hypothetical protein